MATLKQELEKSRNAGNAEASSEVQNIKSELEETRKLVSDYESQLSLVRVESTREYKRTISEPLAKAEKGLADSIAGYEGLNVKDVLKVLDIKDPAQRRAEFKDVMNGVDAMDAWAVKTKLDEIEQLRSKKDDMLKTANDTLAQIERQETAVEQEARLNFDKQADVAFENTWGQFEDSFPILKRGQTPEWDNTIKALREQAVYLDKQPLDHQQRATLTYQAVLFPLAVQVVRDLTEKSNATISDLKAQLQKFQAATPAAGAGTNNSQSAGLPSTVGFLELSKIDGSLMLVVLPVGPQDREQAIRWVNWVEELGGIGSHRLMVACARRVPNPTELSRSYELYVPHDEDERGWPMSPNHLFKRVAQHITWGPNPEAYFWCEPDCIPLVPGWLDLLDSEYRTCGQYFMGAQVNVQGTPEHMSGNAIYPKNVMERGI
mgnify:CR=1 FL=1